MPLATGGKDIHVNCIRYSKQEVHLRKLNSFQWVMSCCSKYVKMFVIPWAEEMPRTSPPPSSRTLLTHSLLNFLCRSLLQSFSSFQVFEIVRLQFRQPANIQQHCTKGNIFIPFSVFNICLNIERIVCLLQLDITLLLCSVLNTYAMYRGLNEFGGSVSFCLVSCCRQDNSYTTSKQIY